jgi:argininosuccinate lyase
MNRGVPLATLSVDEFRSAHAAFDETVFDVLGVERTIAAFTSYGSTNPEQVEHQLASWRERLNGTGTTST